MDTVFKIACIGDSLTYGWGIGNREENCYPAVLNDLLGDDFVVGNFGVNGINMTKKTGFSFFEHENFKLVTLFAPDDVVIMLGTNDANPSNHPHLASYLADYEEMISHFKNLPSKPRIYIVTPPSVFDFKDAQDPENFYIPAETMENMVAALKDLGKKLHVKVIDVNKATANRPECFVSDGVHMNELGKQVIAQTVYRGLTGKKVKNEV